MSKNEELMLTQPKQSNPLTEQVKIAEPKTALS